MIPTEISAETRTLADVLIATSVGELVTLAALSDALGRDVKTCRHVVGAAKKVALRESGAVFATERGFGYRRLSAERVTETVGSSARAHIRRTARRARRTLTAATAAANDLPPSAQRRLSAEVSSLALVEHLARDATVRPSETAPTKPTPVAVTARNLLAIISAPKQEAETA